MRHSIWKTTIGASAAAALALGGATVAVGAGPAATAAATTTTATSTTKTARTPETALTGDALAKVKAAAIAKVGGTVDSATNENDSSNAAAAYEAQVTKADGSRVKVILDSGYAVLSVETGGGRGGKGHGGGGSGETELTGTVANQAKAAAVAKAGGTATRASTENDSSNAAALYEVHVTKADGTRVKVVLDKDFNVLSVETDAHGPTHA